MPTKFDDFIDAVLKGVPALAKQLFADLETQATEDTKAFLDKSRTDLQRWTESFANGKLTKGELTDLTQAKIAVAEIHALTQAGVTLVMLDNFRKALINLIIDSAFAVFLPS